MSEREKCACVFEERRMPNMNCRFMISLTTVIAKEDTIQEESR
ncbi:hypothetical protein [Lacrimispora saccharolytica]|nr:hypothetical protein [Lacrimispora saccharolytica]